MINICYYATAFWDNLPSGVKALLSSIKPLNTTWERVSVYNTYDIIQKIQKIAPNMPEELLTFKKELEAVEESPILIVYNYL
jgi:hypothetical protein